MVTVPRVLVLALIASLAAACLLIRPALLESTREAPVLPAASSGGLTEGESSPPRYPTAPRSLAFPATAEPARSFYVDAKNGSDDGSGTSPQQAWQSLEALNRAELRPGDVVNLAAGSVLKGPLVIEASGEPGQPLVVQGYGQGPKPLILADGDWSAAVVVKGSWVVVSEIAVRDAHHVGIKIEEGAEHNVIRDCEVSEVGIGVGVYGQHNLITHNFIHDLKMVVNTPGGDDDFGAVGIWLFNSHNEVSHNLLVRCLTESYDYGVDGGGIEFWGDVSGSYVHHNWVADSDGLLEVGRGVVKDTVVAYNVSVDNGGLAFFHLAGRFAGEVENFRIEHNTVVENGTQAWSLIGFVGSPGPDTLILRNNVIYVNRFHKVAGRDGFTHDHNTYYLADERTRLGMDLGRGEVLADPQFVDLSRRDFRLSRTSPAVDSAASLGYGEDYDKMPVPRGAGPDQGAFERRP